MQQCQSGVPQAVWDVPTDPAHSVDDHRWLVASVDVPFRRRRAVYDAGFHSTGPEGLLLCPVSAGLRSCSQHVHSMHVRHQLPPEAIECPGIGGSAWQFATSNDNLGLLTI